MNRLTPPRLPVPPPRNSLGGENKSVRMEKDWNVGQTVNVGFVKNLAVLNVRPTVGDAIHKTYTLLGPSGQLYEFTPYGGLRQIASPKDYGR